MHLNKPASTPATRITVALEMTFPDRNTGGTGVYARSLLRELQRRDDVAVRELHGPSARGPVHMLKWLLWGARLDTRDSKAQILHCPAFIAPWRSPAPLIITIHDASTLRFPSDFALEWRLYSRYLLPGLARGASAIITGTSAARVEISRYYGVNQRRIAVTPYGVEERYRAAVDVELAKDMRSRLAPDVPLLLFSGAPIARKNLDVVLRAMAHSQAESALGQARLAISGASEESFPGYRSRTQVMGLTGRVLWLGRVAAEEMPALYAAADLLVYPSFYEGFGLPPLEAMSVGTPVVSSTASCLPEVLGEGAILVSPSDESAFAQAVEEALTRPELRAKLIAAGKAQAARYTWEKCADLTCALYRKVLASQSRHEQR